METTPLLTNAEVFDKAKLTHEWTLRNSGNRNEDHLDVILRNGKNGQETTRKPDLKMLYL